MAIPAILGIGALLKSLFALFILWIQKFSPLALRITGTILLLAGITLIVNESMEIMKDFLVDIVATSPPNVQGAFGLVQHLVPSNLGFCISIVIGMHQTGIAFQWLFYGINTRAKVMTN